MHARIATCRVLLEHERELLLESPMRPQTVIQALGSLIGRCVEAGSSLGIAMLLVMWGGCFERCKALRLALLKAGPGALTKPYDVP